MHNKYVIRFSDGSYYSGKAGLEFRTTVLHEAFHYPTQDGASNKIIRMRWRADAVPVAECS